MLTTPRPMRFGLCTDQNLPWPTLVERWQYFERLGFDSVWDCDHFNQPSRPSGPFYEGWTLLAALAARTERIRVGVLVSCNNFRHPALLAHQAMTVDHVSNGRLELGLGAGWFVPEHAQFGIDFPPPGELVGRFHEAVRIVDTLLRHGSATFTGRHYRLKDAHLRPRPLQAPRPPLTLGAHQTRMLRICAEFADRWNSFGTVAEMRERNQILDAHCAALGRDPGDDLALVLRLGEQDGGAGPPRPVGERECLRGCHRALRRGRRPRVHHRPAGSRAVPDPREGGRRRDSEARRPLGVIRERSDTMKRWESVPGLQRLVKERAEGALSRRAFLARLGGGAAGAALVGSARPAGAQKKVAVTMWDTEPNPPRARR